MWNNPAQPSLSICSHFRSRVNEDSILAVQVFDQKKFKKKDQGFLGVINIRIGDVIELVQDVDGTWPCSRVPPPRDRAAKMLTESNRRSDADPRPEKIDR